MINSKEFTVDFGNDNTMSCRRVAAYSIPSGPGTPAELKPSGWDCRGCINDVHYTLWIEDATAVRVFQVIHELYLAQP